MLRTRSRIGMLVALAAIFVAVEAGAQERKAETGVATIDATKGRDLDDGQKIRVRIRNDLLPTRSMIVSVVTPARPDVVLGIVPSHSSREWEIDTRLIVGGFQLLAESGPRDRRISRRIDVVSRANVSWGLGVDIVRVERIETDDTRDSGD